jgi:quercetin 2,3-dioxygenase
LINAYVRLIGTNMLANAVKYAKPSQNQGSQMVIRKSADRGHANRGWLDSYHSFSFADYYDPNWMSYSALRVINEDVIDAAKGFGTHGHNDMEIITYMLQGELQHADSMGNGSVIKVGDVQRMTAGTGVRHSEFNASKTNSAHLLQIWIMPAKLRLPPSYEEKNFSKAQKQDKLCLIASSDGRDGSVVVHQDMTLYASLLSPNSALDYELKTARSAYIQVATGQVEINQQRLQAGDAAMFDAAQTINIKSILDAEILLFDLPKD